MLLRCLVINNDNNNESNEYRHIDSLLPKSQLTMNKIINNSNNNSTSITVANGPSKQQQIIYDQHHHILTNGIPFLKLPYLIDYISIIGDNNIHDVSTNLLRGYCSIHHTTTYLNEAKNIISESIHVSSEEPWFIHFTTIVIIIIIIIIIIIY